MVVAVKQQVMPQLMDDVEKRERMAIMEAAISSTLCHPNIVQVRNEGVTLSHTCRGIGLSNCNVTATSNTLSAASPVLPSWWCRRSRTA